MKNWKNIAAGIGVCIYFIGSAYAGEADGKCPSDISKLKPAPVQSVLSESEKILAKKIAVLSLWYSDKLSDVAAYLGVVRPEFTGVEPLFVRADTNEQILEYYFSFFSTIKKPEHNELRAKIATWLSLVHDRYEEYQLDNLRNNAGYTQEDMLIAATNAFALDHGFKGPVPGVANRKPRKITVIQPKSKSVDVSHIEQDGDQSTIVPEWDMPAFDTDEVRYHLEKAQGLLLDRIERFKKTSTASSHVYSAAEQVMLHQTTLSVLLFSYLNLTRNDSELKSFVMGLVRAPYIFDESLAERILKMPAPAGAADAERFIALRRSWKPSYEATRKLLEAFHDQ
jgi:hypothetical protein